MDIGIDLTYIPRFKDKDELAKKVLNEDEYNEYLVSLSKETYLASRFALKEALIKCIESDILKIDLKEIKVKKKENGAIYIEYKSNRYEASLSHENEYCVGVVKK